MAALVTVFALLFVDRHEFARLNRENILWLAASVATTTALWIFYYKALADGKDATVAFIDKGSFVVAVLLAWLNLGESISVRTLTGARLIAAGLWVVSRGQP